MHYSTVQYGYSNSSWRGLLHPRPGRRLGSGRLLRPAAGRQDAAWTPMTRARTPSLLQPSSQTRRLSSVRRRRTRQRETVGAPQQGVVERSGGRTGKVWGSECGGANQTTRAHEAGWPHRGSALDALHQATLMTVMRPALSSAWASAAGSPTNAQVERDCDGCCPHQGIAWPGRGSASSAR